MTTDTALNWREWSRTHWPDGQWVTIGEAAELVGRSPRTLRRWRKSGEVLAPTGVAIVGNREVYLYSPEDIAELRAYVHRLRH